MGDEVIVKVGAIEKTLKVSGIYQDITNGGKTAKADSSLGLNEDAVLWYIVNINVAPGVGRADFIARYQSVYPLAQVNDIREYTRQTLGSLIDQMGAAVISGMAVALINIALITALFLRMLFSKDMSQIAIMRSVGLSYNSIKHQYMAGTMLIMAAGIILGTLSSNFLGEIIVSLALSSLGAAKITFVHIAWQTWFLCPLVLMAAVGLTVSLSCSLIVKKDLSVVLRS